MLICIFLIFGFTNGLQGIFIQFNNCGDGGNIVKSVYINPCPGLPCVLRKRSIILITIEFETTKAITGDHYDIDDVIVKQNIITNIRSKWIIKKVNYATLIFLLYIYEQWVSRADETMRVSFHRSGNNSEDYTCFEAPVSISSFLPIRITFGNCHNFTNRVFDVGLDPCVEQPCALRKGTQVEIKVRYYTTQAVSDAIYHLSLEYYKNNITSRYVTQKVIRFQYHATLIHMFEVPGNLTNRGDELLWIIFGKQETGYLSDMTCAKLFVKIVS